MKRSAVQRLRRMSTAAAMVGAVGCAITAWWAWKPIEPPLIEPIAPVAPVVSETRPVHEQGPPKLPMEPFRAAVIPPPLTAEAELLAKGPAQPVASEPNARSGDATLLGIVEERGEYRAAIYFKSSDSVRVLGVNESEAGVTVRRIADGQVELVEAGAVRTLVLTQAAGAGAEGRPRGARP